MRQDLILTVAGQASGLLPAKGIKKKEKGKEQVNPSSEQKQKAKVLGPMDMRLPNPKPEIIQEKQTKGLTLQEKVEEMEIASSKGKGTTNARNDRLSADTAPLPTSDITPKAESLQAVLVQVCN